jgi:hypothetical protein
VVRNADRVLIDLDHLAGHVWPGEALGALARGLGHRGAPVGVEGQRPEGLAERDRVSDRHEHAVKPVASDFAIAGDVRGHHRGARGERLREHHAEALAAERGRAEQVGLAQQAPLLGVVHGPRDLNALRLQEQRLDLLDGGPGDREASLDPGTAQRLEGPQQHGEALALLGAAHEQDLQLLVRAQLIRARRGQIHPIRHDPVAAAVVALRGPARGLRHRDAGAQLRVDPARTEDVRGQLVREGARRVGVERAHHRRARSLGGVPGDHGDVWLMHVDHVVVAVAQLPPQHADRLPERAREVRDRPVHRKSKGPSKRNHVIGQGPRLRRSATVQYTCQTVVGVVWRQ